MPDVFISYSRKDNAFARQLHQALASKGRDVWVDWEDIPLSADWWKEICEGIESADTFLFVMTQESVESPICNFEIAHAVQTGKRIIPILRQKVDEKKAFSVLANRDLDEGARTILAGRRILDVAHLSWGSLARHNWLFFDDDSTFDSQFATLLEIINADLDHAKTHTRLLVRANEWQQSGQDASRLLSGSELETAEAWQASSAQKSPEPTELHNRYIRASRQQQTRRQRTLLTGVSVALVVAVGLAVLSLFLFSVTAQQRAQLQISYEAALAAEELARVRAEDGDELLQTILNSPPSIMLVYDTVSLIVANRIERDVRLNVGEMVLRANGIVYRFGDVSNERLNFAQCVQLISSGIDSDYNGLRSACPERQAWYPIDSPFWLGNGQFEVFSSNGQRFGVCDLHASDDIGKTFCVIEVNT